MEIAIGIGIEKGTIVKEEVSDPYFNNPSAWSLGDGASISNGVLTIDGSQAGNSNNDIAWTRRLGTYIVRVNITAYTAGQVRIVIGGNEFSSWFTGVALHEERDIVITFQSVDLLTVQGDSSFNGSIDFVSVIEQT
jgi:hypothetical protein